jgi:HD-like signal output (HDOD) protein
VLTGQVLKLINSAYYSLPGRVTSLTRAIIMLSANTVKNLVLATSVLALFKRNRSIDSVSMDAYWEHCLCVGVTAKAIAMLNKVPSVEQEEYFVAG